MGVLTNRLNEIARNAQDLSRLADPVRNRLAEGNRAILLGGDTPDGRAVKALRPSTLKVRREHGLSGPPRVPHGSASRLIAGYVVAVSADPGELTASGSWPNFPEAAYVNQARPFTGFRPADLEWSRNKLTDHVFK